jgi:hypothetical protein
MGNNTKLDLEKGIFFWWTAEEEEEVISGNAVFWDVKRILRSVLQLLVTANVYSCRTDEMR